MPQEPALVAFDPHEQQHLDRATIKSVVLRGMLQALIVGVLLLALFGLSFVGLHWFALLPLATGLLLLLSMSSVLVIGATMVSPKSRAFKLRRLGYHGTLSLICLPLIWLMLWIERTDLHARAAELVDQATPRLAALEEYVAEHAELPPHVDTWLREQAGPALDPDVQFHVEPKETDAFKDWTLRSKQHLERLRAPDAAPEAAPNLDEAWRVELPFENRKFVYKLVYSPSDPSGPHRGQSRFGPWSLVELYGDSTF
jgi:hypothetical protein